MGNRDLETRVSTEKSPLLTRGVNEQTHCAGALRQRIHFRSLLIWIFTDWPWETTKYINQIIVSKFEVKPPAAETDCSLKCLMKLFLLIALRLLLIIVAIISQLITCFRRDSPNLTKKLIHDENFNDTSAPEWLIMSCNKGHQIFSGIVIPADVIIFLLAVWIYCGSRLGSKIYQCCGWRELNAVLMADSAESLNKLIIEVQLKITNTIIKRYTLIPLV